jgi:hypothetical protein
MLSISIININTKGKTLKTKKINSSQISFNWLKNITNIQHVKTNITLPRRKK